MSSKKSTSLINLIAYALIGAIAFVVMKFEFPIMPGVNFLKFDFSDVIITIGTFLFGPLAGIIIALIRTLLSLILSGFALPSIVGQTAAFLASMAFSLPFYFFTKKISEKNDSERANRLKPFAGLILGIILMTILMSVANAFVITPIYAVTSMAKLPRLANYMDLYNFTVKVYLGQLLHLPSMGSYIFGLIAPFNILKGLINSVVVYVLFAATLRNIKPFVQKKFNLN